MGWPGSFAGPGVAGLPVGYDSVIRRARTAEAQLPNLVREFAGCLPAMAPEIRRVLMMRAGLYGAAQSPESVADQLHLGRRQERLIEAVGVLELQWVAVHRGCSGMSLWSLGIPVANPFASSSLLHPAPGQAGQYAAQDARPPKESVFHLAGSAARRLAFQKAVVSPLLRSRAGSILLLLVALALLATLGGAAATYWESARRRRIRAALAQILERERLAFYRKLSSAGKRAEAFSEPAAPSLPLEEPRRDSP
jgi:hypothetical protein